MPLGSAFILEKPQMNMIQLSRKWNIIELYNKKIKNTTEIIPFHLVFHIESQSL